MQTHIISLVGWLVGCLLFSYIAPYFPTNNEMKAEENEPNKDHSTLLKQWWKRS